jgi:hypothetical protein
MDKKHYNEIYLIGIFLFATLQFTDLFLTYYHVNFGDIFQEGNPFMVNIVEHPMLFSMVKVFCVAFTVMFAETFRRRDMPLLALVLMWLLTGFSACVIWINITTIVS